jgi:hypothetical protein
MKKLIFAASVAMCGALLAEVSSQNIVGYSTTSTTAKKYNCVGPAFITTGASADGTFMLKDLKVTGFNYEADEVRIIDPATSATSTMLVYFTEADGMGVTGWFDFANEADYNEIPLSLGTGFLTSFGSVTEVAFQSAGEVFNESPTVDCRGNKYQVIPNMLPRSVKLSEIVPTGFNYEKDELRIINPATSATSTMLVYFTEADGMGVTGWFDFANEADYNDHVVEVGDGFLLSSGSENVEFTFPKAIK